MVGVIPDYANGKVDTRTEVLIQVAMTILRKGRISFIIAHRLSTNRHANVFTVMDEGRIVEQDGHHMLMPTHRPYFDVYNS
jgi:ATP-binding cassette subfamily B protein